MSDQTECAVSRTLADFIAKTQFEDLPDSTVKFTRYVLLDALGVSLAAAGSGEGTQAFIDWVREQGAKPQSSVMGHNFKTTASLAAFANGSLAHALDFEDAHDGSLMHPNAACVPAALAISQLQAETSGKQLITALAIGCEIVCRMAMSLQTTLDKFGWYPPPILSAYGATAVSAKLMGLNQQQIVDAFSLTLLQATCSAEIKYNPASHIRAIRDAFPAQAGVIAAQIAQKGVRGFEQPFEGKAGFFAEFARGEYDPEILINNLGQSFEIENLSFKPWPSCRGTHTSIELALQLVSAHQINSDDIQSITIHGSQLNRMLAEPIETKRKPKTAIDAKFSIPFCTASAIVHGFVDLQSFSTSALQNADVIKLANRIDYIANSSFDAQSILKACVEIELADGSKLTAEADNAYGCPDNPLSEADLIRKFYKCLEHSRVDYDEDEKKRFAETVLTIDQCQSLENLFAFI